MSKDASSAKPSFRILLVEDHEDTLRLMTRVLSSGGHQVRPAASCADAREAASSATFDWVISDLGLPDGSGLELMRDLLAKASGPLRGIALTGSVDSIDITACHEAGFTRHLPKPVDLALLEQVLLDSA